MVARVSVLYALHEAVDAFDEQITPLCAAVDLTVAQFSLLYLVVEEGPMRLGELAHHRRCVKSNVSYLVRAMEKNDLLELRADPDDRRVRHVHASAKGLAAFRKVRRGEARIERKLRQALGDEVADELIDRCMAVAGILDGQ